MQTAQKIAIIGSGPMAIYTVKHLIGSALPLQIDVFEADDLAGTGMPYREGMNADFMMSNIFSREIPVIVDSLADWLRRQPQRFLDEWSLSANAISARDFYPRVLLGHYLRAQLLALQQMAPASGHRIVLHSGHRIGDIVAGDGGVQVLPFADGKHDAVVIATGHVWDDDPTEGTASLHSPWPATRLAGLPAGAIGILGSSLSAVDVAVALAKDHGSFADAEDGLTWLPHAGHEGLSITMISKNGILPEADFFYPYPYEPLLHLTEANIAALIAAQPHDTLQGTFDLLIRELQACDPAYVAGLQMSPPTIEAFGDAYFARRQNQGAFRALRDNLAESRKTIASGQTIPWRYAILRGHEAFEHILPHLTDSEWETFRTHLLPVFADCYAAVPHLSLDRLAALRAAGVIDIVDCGDGAVFEDDAQGGVRVTVGDQVMRFALMVDARGQTAAPLAALPFPRLVQSLADPKADLPDDFRLDIRAAEAGQVFCLAMPQLLTRRPFAQGLPNCNDLAAKVAGQLHAP